MVQHDGGARALAVEGALRGVDDPELGIDVVSLGLVREIRIEAETAHIRYTLTSMGCPIGPMIEQDMREAVLGVQGIETVEATLEFEPPWTNEDMTSDAKFLMGMY